MGLALAALAAVAGLVAAAPAAAEEASWAREQLSWWLISVGPHERSVEIAFVSGGCDRAPSAQARESPSAVAISVTVEQPQGTQVVCPALARIVTAVLALRRPLAGRPLAGSWSPGAGPMLSPATPRLVGLAPGDAHRLLAGMLGPGMVRERVRRVIVTGGLPRVLAQYPPPRSALPRDRVVRLLVGSPRTRAFHAAPVR